MLPPIRPRPIIAISIWSASAPPPALADHALDRARQRRPGFGVVAPQRYPQHWQAAPLERAVVTQRLSLLERAERVRLARDRDVDPVVLHHLEEDTLRRSALVQLPGRMQEAGAVAGGGRHVPGVAN